MKSLLLMILVVWSLCLVSCEKSTSQRAGNLILVPAGKGILVPVYIPNDSPPPQHEPKKQ